MLRVLPFVGGLVLLALSICSGPLLETPALRQMFLNLLGLVPVAFWWALISSITVAMLIFSLVPRRIIPGPQIAHADVE